MSTRTSDRDRHRDNINIKQERDYDQDKRSRRQRSRSRERYKPRQKYDRHSSRSPERRYRSRSRSVERKYRSRSRSTERKDERYRSSSSSPERSQHRRRSQSSERSSQSRSPSYERYDKFKSRSNSRPDDVRQNKEQKYKSQDIKKEKKSKENKNDNRSSQRKRDDSPDSRKSKSKISSKQSKSKRRYSSESSSSETESSQSSSDTSTESDSDTKTKHRGSKKRKIDKQKLREKRKKTKEERLQDKELIKSLETPEEKRARRLAKKAAKERKRKERMGWDREMMGYTNADNPFGDPNLLETFVWDKKNQKMGLSHIDKEELKRKSRQKQIENRLELQKVKQRRLEREREKEEREKELEYLQREKESEQFKEWEKEEDSFHLNQAKMRSKIRIQDGRAKPIDLLAQYISAEEEDDLAVEMHEPYKVLNGLTITDLEDLLEDIKIYIELEQGKNVDFWRDMTVITEDELVKLKKIEPKTVDGVERREGINASVSYEVAGIFKGKTYNQLLALRDQIMSKIKSGSSVDIGYWESLLQQLKAHMARARLRERHQERLKNKLYRLRQQQGVVQEPSAILFPSAMTDEIQERLAEKDSGEIQIPEDDDNDEEEPKPSTSKEDEKDKEGESVISEQDLLTQSYDDYNAGKYSPSLLSSKDLPPDTLLFDAEEDDIRLQHARQQVLGTGTAKTSAEAEFEKKAREGMGRDEATFAVEVPSDKLYLWSDKYRPRKPRYFNRVHTGFEWNKYNQTHYDMDNPPPKIVQGYKFNIFYPDLIDKRKTPEYTLTPCDDKTDFATLKFHAGPPYEDIAFKIVNREWEYSHRHGFRCQYSNGIFQLWFHFKRYRYRR